MMIPEEQAAHYHFTVMEFKDLLEQFKPAQVFHDDPELYEIVRDYVMDRYADEAMR